jgi:hypothetical protein
MADASYALGLTEPRGAAEAADRAAGLVQAGPPGERQ